MIDTFDKELLKETVVQENELPKFKFSFYIIKAFTYPLYPIINKDIIQSINTGGRIVSWERIKQIIDSFNKKSAPIHEIKRYKEFLNPIKSRNNKIRVLHKIALNVLGEEAVSLDVYYSVDTPFRFRCKTLGLSLKFSNITITSELGYSLPIHDMYVLIKDSVIEGQRATFSYTDILSKYDYSHLSDIPANKGRFCFGPTYLADAVFLIQTCLRTYNSSILKHRMEIEQFFFSLKDYLSWESIEGTPYKNMYTYNDLLSEENIVYTHYPSLSKDLIKNILSKNIDCLIDRVEPVFISKEEGYEIDKNSIKDFLNDIKTTEKQFLFLVTVLEDKNGLILNFDYKDRFCELEEEAKKIIKRYSGNIDIKFKGEYPKRVFINNFEELHFDETSIKESFSPKFIEDVKDVIETIFQNYLIKKYYEQKERKTDSKKTKSKKES